MLAVGHWLFEVDCACIGRTLQVVIQGQPRSDEVRQTAVKWSGQPSVMC